MKKNFYLILLTLCCVSLTYGQKNDTLTDTSGDTLKTKAFHKLTKEEMRPKFTATILGRYEYNTIQDKHHFELRHTRIGVSGDLHPMFSYMALVDLTYGGGFSPVAIFAKFKPVKGLSFLIGYDKMPFSNENLLSPYQYYFSDKSFLTQRLTAWSDVGGVVEYKWDKVVPFSIKAGVFNSGGFSKQMQFQKSLNYVARGTFNFFKGFELSLNYAAVKYETVRMHNFDFGVKYDIGGLHLDAEYIYKFFSDKGFAPVHAFEGFAYYSFPINKPWLNNIAIALRYDAITPNCTGKFNELGEYTWDTHRQRITAGLTLIFIEKPVRTGIRLNYEKFFSHAGDDCRDDRVILELIVHY
ncbi:MAG: OprO/OprP family phosphate-selective porin [Bacteroidales bacterium]|nr:OprO/OprP family phosphate-selective porin [Bacteroidales bacterium]